MNSKVMICGIDTSSLPKISAQESTRLLERIAQSDLDARDEFIVCNMRLVLSIIKRFWKSKANSDDVFQAGMIGLIKAINTYKPGHGTALATYTARCIENEILMLIRANKKHKNTVSLSDPVGTDKEGNAISLLEIIVTEDEDYAEVCDEKEKLSLLPAMLKQCLEEREREIIAWRYGLYSGRELTQREIADSLGISRSYVSRIEKKALRKLREEYERLELA